MMVHVLSGRWPFPGEAVKTNPSNPSELIAVSEFDRHETTVKLIDDTHPFMPLIKQCLSNSPSLRPTAFEIYEQVSVVVKDNPPSYANRAIMLETIKIFRKEKEMSRIEIENLRAGMDAILTQFEKDAAILENTLLSSQLAEMHRKLSDLKKEAKQLCMNICDKEQEIDTKKKELPCREAAPITRRDSLKTEPDKKFNSVIKGLDIFTQQGVKFSSTRCATFDISIRLPACYLY